MAKVEWPVKTLGEVLTLVYGKPLEVRDRDENGPIPVYGANGVKAKSRRSLVAGPSIIVGRKGSAGELNVCKGPFWPLDVTYYVEHDLKKTDLLFLYYLLSLMDLPSLAKGVKPGINRNEVYALTAPVPPLEEQKRIVALLDDATARINELAVCYEQARTHANNLFTSALRAGLEGNPDWPVKTLGEICNFQNGCAFRSSEYVKNGHALIRIKNVQQGEIIPSDDVFVKIPKDGSLDQFVLDAGDILMSLTGYLGRVGRLRRAHLPAALNQRVAKVSIKSSESMCDGFLYRVLDSQWFRDQVEIFGRGAAQQNVGTSDISKIEIPVPPLEEQKRIVARLDSMRAKTSEMVAAYDAKLQAAKNLRQSILESAFAGEL